MPDETLLIQPGRFIASGGKLDSNKLYIRRAKTGASQYMALPDVTTDGVTTHGVIDIAMGGVGIGNLYVTLRYNIDQASVRVGTSDPPIPKPFLKVVI